MADREKGWPALLLETTDADPSGEREGLLAAVLADFDPVAIEDLVSPPLPPGGLWDPTAPPPPEPPPAPLRWRATFRAEPLRDAAAAAVRAMLPLVQCQSVELPDEDWAARSQQALRAITAGRFIVAPPWDVPAVTPDDAHVIVIEPSMGFGTGHHATTRLCLRALDAVSVRDRRVLDIGTGSGVLALAARRLGARDVEAVDIDADAIEAACRSAALNPQIGQVQFRVADFHDEAAGLAPADVLLANLTGAMLTRGRQALGRLLAPGGQLVLSGFMRDEVEAVRAAFGPEPPALMLEDEGWVSLVWASTGSR